MPSTPRAPGEGLQEPGSLQHSCFLFKSFPLRLFPLYRFSSYVIQSLAQLLPPLFLVYSFPTESCFWDEALGLEFIRFLMSFCFFLPNFHLFDHSTGSGIFYIFIYF